MVRDVGIGAGEEEKGEGGRRYHSRDGVLTQEQARGEMLGFKNVTTHL